MTVTTNATLPPGWIRTTLGEAFQWSSGGTPRSGNPKYYGGEIPWVVIGDLNDGPVTATASAITEAGLRESAAKWVEKGSVLIAMYGSIGKLGIAGVRLTTNQAIAFTNPAPANPKYLFWYLASIRGDLLRLGKGGTQLNISQTVLKGVAFPLAPVQEQVRIVAALEEHLSHLDAAVLGIRRAQANLARYRDSVRAAAVQGVFSPDAPVSGWKLLTLGECASGERNSITDGPFGSKLKTAHYTDDGPRVVRLQNIGDGMFVDARACISESHFATLQKHRVHSGDLVIAALGESLPRACLVPDHLGPAIVKADCIRFRPDSQVLLAEFANIVLNAEPTRKRVASMVHGIGRPRLNLTEMKSIELPVPSIQVQRAVVAEVERRLAVAERTSESLTLQLARAARLRQAILRAAFSGALVPASSTAHDAVPEATVRVSEPRARKNPSRRRSERADPSHPRIARKP